MFLRVAVSSRACRRKPSSEGSRTRRNAGIVAAPLLQARQGRLAPPLPLDVEDLGLEHQLVSSDLLDAEGVEQRVRLRLAVDEAQHLYGRLAAEGGAGVGVGMAHEHGHVRPP